jgi:hypothetical protein
MILFLKSERCLRGEIHSERIKAVQGSVKKRKMFELTFPVFRIQRFRRYIKLPETPARLVC